MSARSRSVSDRDHVGALRPVAAHPHIEWSVEGETRNRARPDRDASTTRRHRVRGRRWPRRQPHAAHLQVRVLDQRQPAGILLDQTETTRDGGLIAVDADHPGTRRRRRQDGTYSRRPGAVDVNPPSRTPRSSAGRTQEYEGGSASGRRLPAPLSSSFRAPITRPTRQPASGRQTRPGQQPAGRQSG